MKKHTKQELENSIREMQSIVDDPEVPENVKELIPESLAEAKRLLHELEAAQAQEKKVEKKSGPIARTAKAAARKHTQQATRAAKKIIPSLRALVKKSPKLKGYMGKSEKQLQDDAGRRAKKPGARISSTGKPYREYRLNRSDVSARKFPYLEQGGHPTEQHSEQTSSTNTFNVFGYHPENFTAQIKSDFEKAIMQIESETDKDGPYFHNVTTSFKEFAMRLDQILGWENRAIETGISPQDFYHVIEEGALAVINNYKSGYFIDTGIVAKIIQNIARYVTYTLEEGGVIDNSKYVAPHIWKVKTDKGFLKGEDHLDYYYSRGQAIKKAALFNGKIEKHVPKFAIVDADPSDKDYSPIPWHFFGNREDADLILKRALAAGMKAEIISYDENKTSFETGGMVPALASGMNVTLIAERLQADQTKFQNDPEMKEHLIQMLEHANEIGKVVVSDFASADIEFPDGKILNISKSYLHPLPQMTRGGKTSKPQSIHTYREINWEQFEKEFKPEKNKITKREEFNGWLYETYGEDEEYVKEFAKKNPNRVWTILDVGYITIGNGWHYVNRFGYIITKKAFDPNQEIEVVDPEDKEESEGEEELVKGGKIEKRPVAYKFEYFEGNGHAMFYITYGNDKDAWVETFETPGDDIGNYEQAKQEGLKKFGMKNLHDIASLKSYLVENGIIEKNDKLKASLKTGGKIGFKDKVSSISKNLKGRKVPAKYRKQYGTTYDKEEATLAAQRIAGAIQRREKA